MSDAEAFCIPTEPAEVLPQLETPREIEGLSLTHELTYKGTTIEYTTTFGHATDRLFLVVGGFIGVEPAYDDFRKKLSKETDATVVSFKHPRKQAGIRDILPGRLLHPEQLGKEATIILVKYLRALYPEMKITLVGHSMGGPTAIDTALELPDDIEDVILVGSGGLEAGQNIGRIAKRAPGIIMNEGRSIVNMPKDNILELGRQAGYHIFRNPFRTFFEAMNIAHRDLMESEIKELIAHGIGVFAVQLENDGFFPTKIAERDAGKLVSSFNVIEALNHVGPQADEEIVAKFIANLLKNQKPKLELVS